MEIASHAAPSRSAIRDHDRLIMLGYLAFVIVAIALLYSGSTGPGFSEAELAMAAVLP